MSSRPPLVNRPTIYLDQSHWSEAFRARHGAPNASIACRKLADEIERLSPKTNVIISSIHVIELSRWNDDVARRGMCDWLDGLQLVWARSKDWVERAEEERCLRIVAGLTVQPLSVWAPSMLTSLDDVKPHDLSTALVNANIRTYVEQARLQLSSPWQSSLRNDLGVLRDDWKRADDVGLDAATRMRITQANERADLMERGRAAHRRLRGDPIYAARHLDEDVAAELFARRIQEDERAMPSYTAFSRHVRSLIQVGARRRAGSKGEGSILSAPLDAMHIAVGGAYSDIFTCDAEADDWLGGVRLSLGLERQLSAIDTILARLALVT